jgi:putative membrane protein
VVAEPDARFSLANERTFLAWNRTALALVAGGLAIVQFTDDALGPVGARLAVGLPLVCLGAVLAGTSHRRLRANQAALVADDPLPGSPLPALLAGVVAAVAAVAAVLAVVQAAAG